MMEILKGKTVLITGGTGSFGKAFAKKLLENDQIEKLIIFSRDEWKQWEMQQKVPLFNHPKLRYFLGDIRDKDRLEMAFRDVDIVIHAAALKQVPAAEYNPSEFIKTNVMGAMNIISAAIRCQVKQVIALSTDKAVNPINLYGASKLCSDKLFIASNAYVGLSKKPTFSVVRYGNVLGSRGSVLPCWEKLIEEGAKELPITDKRMTRFWITLEQAVDFVLQCLTIAKGEEIFVPKIPSVKITDLAHAIAKDLPQREIGIREGEKLHELMISSDDSRHTLEFDDHYIILHKAITKDLKRLEEFLEKRKSKHPKEGFAYTSDTNSQWLSGESLKALIDSVSKKDID